MTSKKAIIIEKALKLIGMKKITYEMFRQPRRKNKYENPPKIFFKKYTVKTKIINNSKCISLKSSINPKKHILYFHGGNNSCI